MADLVTTKPLEDVAVTRHLSATSLSIVLMTWLLSSASCLPRFGDWDDVIWTLFLFPWRSHVSPSFILCLSIFLLACLSIISQCCCCCMYLCVCFACACVCVTVVWQFIPAVASYSRYNQATNGQRFRHIWRKAALLLDYLANETGQFCDSLTGLYLIFDGKQCATEIVSLDCRATLLGWSVPVCWRAKRPYQDNRSIYLRVA